MADLVRGRENRVHWVRIGHQLIHEGITVLILGVHQGGCGGLQPNIQISQKVVSCVAIRLRTVRVRVEVRLRRPRGSRAARSRGVRVVRVPPRPIASVQVAADYRGRRGPHLLQVVDYR